MKRLILSCLVFLFSMFVTVSYSLAFPPPIEVDIDIKPGSCPNSINLKSHGAFAVAIFGTADFDVRNVDSGTVLFNYVASPLRWGFEDVDGDGYEDLVFLFKVQESGLVVNNLWADLTGELMDGTPFYGIDTVRILHGD